MDKNKKIAFIICVNNELYFSECRHYLSSLEVPDGFETEIIPVRNSVSMTSAYNRAIMNSDAKYKVYLHQDIFVVNKKMIKDVLEIFGNPEIGMIGLAGCDDVSEFLHTHNWTAGELFNDNAQKVVQLRFRDYNFELCEVDAIDGMIMITQYDLRWRDDVFTGWHYYDLSQSMEFKRNGYKIVVPGQKTPWIMHDSGVMSYENYLYWQKIFENEYYELIKK